MTLFRLPEPPPEEKSTCEMDMRYLEHLRADSYKQGLEAATKLIERTEMSGLQSYPEMQLFIAQLLSGYATAIRKLMEGL